LIPLLFPLGESPLQQEKAKEKQGLAALQKARAGG